MGPGSIDIVPTSPTYVSNCIPFGNNTSYGFTGFIYRNVPAFNLGPGSRFAFDLGRLNDVDIRRNIYFATANINPAPVPYSGNVVSQGIFAASGWTQVVTDAQTPQNPRGNTISGDYELIYTATASFSFPGGGLIVGFGGSPPGAFADFGCQQVLVRTNGGDASGFFYARFFYRPDQSLGVLDGGSGGTGSELGGIVIQANNPPDCSAAGPSVATLWPPNHQFASINVLGVTDPDGDAITINIDGIRQDEPTDTFGDGKFTPDGQGVGTSTAEVRAERAVPGNGRVYHISFSASDTFGASCSSEVLVGVPHDERGGAAVDDGPLYDSSI